MARMERMGQQWKFEPEKRRYIFWQSASMILGVLVASAIIYAVTGVINWVLVATFVIGYPISMATLGVALLDIYSIVISDGYISGRTASGLGRTKFALERVDKQRTRRRTLFQRLFGYMYIYSLDGQRIIFYERQFEPADVDAILELIGLEPGHEGWEQSN